MRLHESSDNPNRSTIRGVRSRPPLIHRLLQYRPILGSGAHSARPITYYIGAQLDMPRHPRRLALLSRSIATKTRDGSSACLTASSVGGVRTAGSSKSQQLLFFSGYQKICGPKTDLVVILRKGEDWIGRAGRRF